MFESIINLFFPKVCSGCNAFLIANENVICTVCRHDIPLTNHHLNPENDAFKKFYGRIPVVHTSALFYFHKKGIVQVLIHNLKYKGHEEIGTILGEWYAEDLKNIELLTTVNEIIPVPLHRRKLKERGYNQVTAFGKALSTRLNVAYNDSLLIRNVYSKTQSKKNLLGRTEGIESIFDVSFTEKNHNKHFLLIDDVITTGATLEACSRAILKIPGAKISIVCMAMAQS
ncbi:ComF family protein [Flavobacterium sp. LS1P28]|uniref:ComF family protein n=1 Tax=unclassified Flavobacterium TaxID=196869 RepID=UPI000F84DBF5|nr:MULTISPECIES: ComF family protein [unclassified Flavobacterium]RTY73701.1 ComF family protein [Flavobacterium sp. LS1R10]RTY79551.1 ComF family protein [Flavobacterium sp. LS1P28]RTY83983.1 ComF family protein [Flavobacterium sp. ZB4P23]RTY90452.1 ComF family protein [Flavobacterium sp. RSP46]